MQSSQQLLVPVPVSVVTSTLVTMTSAPIVVTSGQPSVPNPAVIVPVTTVSQQWIDGQFGGPSSVVDVQAPVSTVQATSGAPSQPVDVTVNLQGILHPTPADYGQQAQAA